MAHRTQDMFVFDNCSHFVPLVSDFSLPLLTSTKVGFIIELSAPTTLEFVYMRRPWLFCWTTTSFLRNFILVFLLRSSCFSFDNLNLLHLLSRYLDWHVLWYLALLAYRMDNKFSFLFAIWLKSNFKSPSLSNFGVLVASPSLLDRRTSLVLLWQMKHRFQFVLADLPILSVYL